MNEKKNRITFRAFLFGTLFAAFFAALNVYMINRQGLITNSTQISLLPYLLVIVTVLLLNPLCRLIRVVRAFSSVEIMVIFIMGMVSSGLSGYGLAMPIVPIIGNLFNAEWNNRQSEWNRYVVPLLNEKYFVTEPGIQAAAAEYRKALTAMLEKGAVYESASRVSDQAKVIAAMEAELAGTPESNAVKRETLKASLASLRRVYAVTCQEWQALRGQHNLPEWQEVLRLFPALLDQEEVLVDKAEQRLLALEKPVFEKVAVFRRGLPREQSAFPGILPLAGDDRRAYFGRLRRLIGGMAALSQVREVWASARSLPGGGTISPELAASYGGNFTRAVKALSALSDPGELERLREQLREEEKGFAEKRVELAGQLKAVSEEKRKAGREQALALNSRSDGIIAGLKSLEREYNDFKKRLECCHREMECAENIQALVSRINELQQQASTKGEGHLRYGELASRLTELMPLFPSVDISLRRYFLGEVPWNCWLKPLALWAVLAALTYIILMAFNVLIFRQWAHNERLTYPLAELPKALVGEADSIGLPPVFRSGLFWIGVAISGGVMGWNLFCATQIVPGLTPLNFAMPTGSWNDYVVGTKFEALRTVRTEIFFTVLGVSFLVPKNISFSLWFFYLVYLVELLFLVWSGYGIDVRSFPWDTWTLANFRLAQGQGALIVFSGLVLYKCRKYILCAFSPSSVAELEEAERKELWLSSIAFLGCSLGLILMLWLSVGANLFFTIFFYLMLLVITIVLTRGVAEGGLFFFQTYATPLHYVRTFLGFDRSWTSASLFAPLMVYYAILFLDIKSLISPAMANALKLREDYRLKRFSFHIIVAVAVIIASVIAVVTNVMMCYEDGLDTMCYPFFSDYMPRNYVFGMIRSFIKNAPTASAANMGWTVGGGFVMAALLFFRQYFFWLPHPIGMIMLVNGLIDGHWFSIFVGWLCNVAVTKYGNKDTFHRAKGFFIGLIIGELIIVIASFVVYMTMGGTSGVIIRFDRH